MGTQLHPVFPARQQTDGSVPWCGNVQKADGVNQGVTGTCTNRRSLTTAGGPNRARNEPCNAIQRPVPRRVHVRDRLVPALLLQAESNAQLPIREGPAQPPLSR